MATYTINITETTGSGSGSIYSRLGLPDINKSVNANIPRYSVINSVQLNYYAMETTNKVGKADLYLFFGDSSNNSIYQLYYGNGVIPKNSSEYVEVQGNMKNYVSSNSEDAGTMTYSGADYLTARFQSSLLSRTYKRYGNILYDFTRPTFTISAKAGTGGAVSGGGTYSVATTEQTKTITATPNNGYKFVKWVCSDGTTYEGESYKTLPVTISHYSINAHETTVTYTAYFEVDKINYILVDTSQSAMVLIDEAEANEIIADTTKVYG